MKTKFIPAFCCAMLCAMVSPLVVSPHALAVIDRLDLSMRRAIYITGNKTTIDLKNDIYIADGETKTVSRRWAVSRSGTQCKFNLGIIATLNGGQESLTTYGLFSGKFGLVGNGIIFANGEKSKQQVLPVELSVGSNSVKFEIDPYKKTAETDESNNSFSVTIVVE